MELNDLINSTLFSGMSVDESADNFDWENAVITAADTLRLALMSGHRTTIIQSIGALGALGIELEDCKFITAKDMNLIASILMS